MRRMLQRKKPQISNNAKIEFDVKFFDLAIAQPLWQTHQREQPQIYYPATMELETNFLFRSQSDTS